MARGQQKLQSQAKAAEKASKLKKQQGHSATDQKKAAQKALVHACAVCKVRDWRGAGRGASAMASHSGADCCFVAGPDAGSQDLQTAF